MLRKPSRRFLLIFIFHLSLTILLMFASFSLVMKRSGERQLTSTFVSADHPLDSVLHSAADFMTFPLGYTNPAAGEASFLVDLLPGAWSWLVLPFNSLLWATALWAIIPMFWIPRKSTPSI